MSNNRVSPKIMKGQMLVLVRFWNNVQRDAEFLHRVGLETGMQFQEIGIVGSKVK